MISEELEPDSYCNSDVYGIVNVTEKNRKPIMPYDGMKEEPKNENPVPTFIDHDDQ